MVYYCEYEDERILSAATALIDMLTFNRITERGFENLTPFQRERISLACLRQCEYFAETGFDVQNIRSIAVEDFRLEYGKTGKIPELCEYSYALLCQTGLMCEAVKV